MKTNNPKYPFHYGGTIQYSVQGAIKSMFEFVNVINGLKEKSKERSFHLYLNENEWIVVADSVKEEYGKGKHIQEFTVQH